MKKGLLVFTSALLLTSCAFGPNRSYLGQMEDDDDSGFMVPGEDFPVVAGDNGSSFRTRRQILKRTPASGAERDRYNQEFLLEDELERLVEEQSEEKKDHYRLYEYKLTSHSEKIYFLKLPTIEEREEYVESKGLSTQSSARYVASSGGGFGTLDIAQGMTKGEVLGVWGQPYSIEVAGNPKYENERWAYRRKGRIDHVYFESGKVDGWKKSR